ncbi:MAG: VCBS repeat-containing protein [Acidobacteria bacterium]|nr:VCBS repeat-containing protein [Acidobacteriota bacterium]MBI3426146.1 VCBS repeat-containing protein [Acidobacteriota bacterium]
MRHKANALQTAPTALLFNTSARTAAALLQLAKPADFDGDGKTDLSVWRGAEGNWYIKRSSDNQSQITAWGAQGDQPIPSDYDGDGKTDLAVFRRATGTWYILKSSNGATQTQAWGVGTDLPVPGDYDGDGKTDIAVWRPSDGTWYALRSSNGSSLVQAWGQQSDIPVPSSGVPNTPPAGSLSIGGQVTTALGVGLGGLTLTLSGSLGLQTVTNSSGQYSFTGLASGGSFTVTGSQSGYYFSPVNRSYPTVTANVTNANFIAAPVLQPPPSTFTRTVNYAYNYAGALAGIGTDLLGNDPNNTTNVATAFGYRAWGMPRTVDYGNGTRLTADYNPMRQQLANYQVQQVGSGSVLLQQYYDYYENGINNGKVRKLADNASFANHRKFTYDGFNRLTGVTVNGSYVNQYGYDRWGNITNLNNQQSLTYQTGPTGAPTNRLSTAGGASFGYDAAGNMTANGATTYSYDGANRLVQAGSSANVSGYDGANRRYKASNNGNLSYYVWSSVLAQPLLELDSTAGVKRASIYHKGELLALQSTDGQFYWSTTDHLSSARLLTNTAGNVAYTAQFDPFGQIISEWSASGDVNLNTRKFATYERDVATGLDYAQARTYGSGWGRFAQADPKGRACNGQKPDVMGAAQIDRPQSFNRYAYAMNDPANNFDPTGLSCVTATLACIAAAGYFLLNNVAIVGACASGFVPGCFVAIATHPLAAIAAAAACANASDECSRGKRPNAN